MRLIETTGFAVFFAISRRRSDESDSDGVSVRRAFLKFEYPQADSSGVLVFGVNHEISDKCRFTDCRDDFVVRAMSLQFNLAVARLSKRA